MSAQGERERQGRDGEAQEREVDAQEGHGIEEETTTQEECVEDKKEGNSVHEGNDVSNRHMTWWRDAWWVRMDNGPRLRTARGRRRVWRAALRAARETRETGRVAGGEREKWEQGTTGRKKQHTARRLPLRKRNNHHSNSNNRSGSGSALAVTTAET